MFVTVRRSVLTTVAVLALAGTAAAPSVADAAPNNGGGAGESALCKSLLDRLKRYHAISKNPKETQSVRDYYAAQARLTLVQGQLANCKWATPRAIVAGSLGVGVDAGVYTRAAKRSAARAAGGQTTTTPGTGAGASVTGIKAQPTGNSQQDEYCSKVAELIDEAYSEGDAAWASGDNEGGQAWYDLAGYYTDRATQNGCRFTFGIKRVAGTIHVAGTLVASRG